MIAAGKIGPYEIIRHLGEGGMGTVYLCQQTKPVRRQVAVKLMHRSLGSRDALLRFQSERQALARLAHPNIAQLYEAGTTQEGFPYFVMEAVDGAPITDYCDSHRLSVKQRLRLFQDVCDGVTHAHQKGILHRDMKPSNLLVTQIDGQHVPKVIDFGVAKAIDRPLVDATLQTGGRLVGTPPYMSPEAIDGEALDTRADVYSLGVILHELLVGKKPFSGEALAQIVDEIRTTEPSRPSTKFNSLGEDERRHVAIRRNSDMRALAKRLSGDLDWIVLKALAKDRDMRYGSPAEFSADVERYLCHEPVSARPPSIAYRMRKFVRRRRGLVASAALLLIALAAGVVARSIEAERANREAEAARQALAETREVSDFLVGLFEIADPTKSLGKEVTARELLDRGAQVAGQRFADQPLARARFLSTIGRSYLNLGLLDEAETQFEAAFAIYDQVGDAHFEPWLESMRDLADLRRIQGRYDDAHQLFEKSLAAIETRDPTNDLLRAKFLDGIAFIDKEQGRYQEAKEKLLVALDVYQNAENGDKPQTTSVLNKLAIVEDKLGNYEQSEQLHKRALALREELFGPQHLHVAESLLNLSGVLKSLGRYDEGMSAVERALEIRKSVYGTDHNIVAKTMNNKALLHQAAGQIREAGDVLQEALAIREKALGSEHPSVAVLCTNLASVAFQLADYRRGTDLLQRALDIRQKTLEPEHPLIAQTLANLGVVLMSQEQYAAAETHLIRAWEIRRKRLQPDHPDLAFMAENLAALYFFSDQLEKAEPFLLKCLAIREKSLPTDHPLTARILDNLGSLYHKMGDHDRAEVHARRSYEMRRRSLAADHPELATSMSNLGRILADNGRLDEAESLYHQSLAIKEKKLGADHPSLVITLTNLANLMEELKKIDEAERYYRRGLQIIDTKDVPSDEIERLVNYLCDLLLDLGRKEEADELKEKYNPADPT